MVKMSIRMKLTVGFCIMNLLFVTSTVVNTLLQERANNLLKDVPLQKEQLIATPKPNRASIGEGLH